MHGLSEIEEIQVEDQTDDPDGSRRMLGIPILKKVNC